MITQKKQPLWYNVALRVLASVNARSEPLRARYFLEQIGDNRAFQWGLPSTLVRRVMLWKDVFPFPPKTLLDVGAHTGAFSLDLADLFQLDFCAMVEPIPELATALDALRLPCRSKVFNCAIGASNGKANLHILENISSSSLMQVNPESTSRFQRSMTEVSNTEVPLRTLDEVFGECGIATLDLLKLDVQGYELQVCAGGSETLAKTRMIYMEMSFFEHYLGQPLCDKIIFHLHQFGFRLRGTYGFTLSPEGHPLQCDAVFVNIGL